MKQFDLRESKTKFIWIILGSAILPVMGLSIGGPVGMIFITFGLFAIGVGIWKIMQKGRSGMLFSTTSFDVELANGQKYTYHYSDVEMIGLQEMQMPGYVNVIQDVATVGTLFMAPANLVIFSEMYAKDFTCLAIKFKPGITIPQPGRADTYLYTKDKLAKWKDEEKQDLYLAFHNNVPQKKRKKLVEFLQQEAKQEIKIGPPLAYK